MSHQTLSAGYPETLCAVKVRHTELIKPFRPQSDPVEATDFESKVSISNEATTTFIEAAPEVMGTASLPTSMVSTYVEQMADIKAFLSKPILLSSGSWTTSQPNNTNLASGSVASALINNAMWFDKIKGFNLFKGDFIVRVELNASPFQQGKLLLHYVPCYNDFVAANAGFAGRVNRWIEQKIQRPHVELDCRTTSIAMRIPYIAPSHFYGVKEGKYDWGTWFLDVYSALMTGTAAPAGQLLVDYLVYGYWENVELAAPTIPQSGKRERVSKNVVKEKDENRGPIEEGLRKVGKSSALFNEVPLLSEFAKPVSWAADLAAQMAHIWGWSKPRELDGVTVVAQNTLRYAGTADGPSLAVPGGVIARNRIETVDYCSYTNEDEMSLAYLFKIPFYGGELTWGSAVGQGTSLMSLNVTPSVIKKVYTDTISTHSMQYQIQSPLGYLSQFFAYYRGGIEFTMKFIKTQMHSGRLQVTFTPTTAFGTTTTMTNSSYALRAIVDIRTEDEVTFTLPYLAYTDYLSTTIDPVGSVPGYLGKLDVMVLNDLRAPESCAQSIAIQVFYRGAPDFELAVPAGKMPSVLPYVPQSGKEEIMHSTNGGDGEMVDMVIGGYKTKDDPTLHSSRCIGERVLSIKQLLLRNSPIISLTSWTWSSHPSLAVWPHFLPTSQLLPVTGTLTKPNFGGDLLGLLAPMYAFMRGSVNIQYQEITATQADLTYLNFGNFPNSLGVSTIQPVVDYTNNGNFGLYNGSQFQTQTTMNNVMPTNRLSERGVAYQHVPYYNSLPFTLTLQYNGTENVSDPSLPRGTFTVYNQSVKAPMIQRSVGDDFQLTFFMGCPPMPTSYT